MINAEETIVRIGDTKTVQVTLIDWNDDPIADVKAYLNVEPATRGQITPVDGVITNANGVATFTFSAEEIGSTTFTVTARTADELAVEGKVEKIIEILRPAVVLTINKEGNGTITPNVGAHTYTEGDDVTITAIPDPGWKFVRWDGTVAEPNKTTTSVTLDTNQTVTAVFEQLTYTLTIDKVGNGEVTVTPSGPYHYNDEVTLTATPDLGWEFVGWSDNVDSENSVKITDNTLVSATFEKMGYRLTVNNYGNGTVFVTPVGPYYYNTVVTLVAIPDPGWQFVGWSSNVDAANSITITDDITVTATFEQIEYELTIQIQGQGTVNKTPDGPYYYNDEVTLTAIPALGWEFIGWSSNVDAEACITITDNTTVIAIFEKIEYELTVQIQGGGKVAKTPEGPYYYNAEVKLTATPDPGWEFIGWSDNVGAEAWITITDSTTVTAIFEQIEYELTIEIQGEGTVTKSSAGPYYYGDVITLRTYPDAGWTFAQWEGDLTGNNKQVLITVEDNLTLTAVFAYLIRSDKKNEITMLSDNGALLISVPANAVPEDISLNIEPTNLDAEQQAAIEALNPIGVAYKMSDMQFLQPVTLVFSYKDENDDGIVDGTGILETDLRIFYWNGSQWVDVGGNVDPSTNTVTGVVTHLSTYAVMGDSTVQTRQLLSDVAFLANPFEPAIDGETPLRMFLRDPARVTLTLWNKRGNKIIHRVEKNLSGYTEDLFWNGKDTLGREVPTGLYIYQVTAIAGEEREQITGLLSIKR